MRNVTTQLEANYVSVPVSDPVHVFDMVDAPEEFFEVVQRLREIAALPQGWDGGRSAPLSKLALRRALGVAVRVGQMTPIVVPVPGGGVQFEFERGERYLEIEVLPDGAMVALATLAGEVIDERELFDADIPALSTWVRQI